MSRRVRTLRVLVLAAAVSVHSAAFAQTTVVLDGPDSEVTDAVVRGGSYANRVDNGAVLFTRASSDRNYVRRALLKFDTENKVPKGAAIQSATLTLTVRGGNDETRTLGVYRVSQSFQEAETTWNVRRTSTYWSTAGGDLAARYATASVSNTPGSKVTFNLTSLVQQTVNGSFGSRYTRVAVIDAGSSSRDSYREYHSSEASDPSVRPRLTIVYGSSSGSTSSSSGGTSSSSGGTSSSSGGTSSYTGSGDEDTAPVRVPSTSGSTLRVLHWNLHHGVGTDGRYNLDRIATWIAKIRPDVVSLNEVERYTHWGDEDQPARYAALLRAKTGQTWYYAFRTGTGGSKGIGNAVLSRFPLAASSYCQLDGDSSAVNLGTYVSGRMINLWSTHLSVDSGTERRNEIKALLSCTSNFSQQRIIAGDFNTQSSSTEISMMTADYYDGWAEAKTDGTALAYPGNTSGATRNSRIDYVFSSEKASLSIRSAQVFDTRDSDGIMPSDHKPLLITYAVQ